MRQTIPEALLILILSGGVLAGAAAAQGTGRSYIGGQVGLVVPDGYSLGVTGSGGSGSADFDLDRGGSIGLVIGRQFGNSWRGEVELSYQSTDANSLRTVTDAPDDQTARTSGSVSSTQLSLNAWYDIPTTRDWTPYLGGGLGIARVEGDVQGPSGPLATDSDSGYLGQLGFGVQFPLGGAGAVDLGYRYKAIRDADLNLAPPGSSTSDGKFDNHVLSLGYNFNF